LQVLAQGVAGFGAGSCRFWHKELQVLAQGVASFGAHVAGFGARVFRNMLYFNEL